MKNQNLYIPPSSAPRYNGSGRITLPSGATPSQISEYQLALMALGIKPQVQSSVTGAMPVATSAQISEFQRRYNAENACRRNPSGAGCHPPYSNSGFQPATLTVNGVFDSATETALGHYRAFGRGWAVQQGLSASAPSITPMGGPTTPSPTQTGWDPKGTPGTTSKPGTLTTTQPSTVTHTSPTPATPPAAPVTPPASTFPTGPVIAGVVGLGVIGLAFAWKQSQKHPKRAGR